jgi:general secretion pathway protein B
MSYILDALKRAESERSRGAVPNIHAQLAAPAVPEAVRPTPLRIGLGVIALLIVLAAGWAVWWPDDVPPPPSAPSAELTASVPSPVPAATAVPPVFRPVPVAPRAAVPAIVPVPRPSVADVAPAPLAPPVLPRARKAQAVAGASAAAARPASVPVAEPLSTASAAAPATTDERVYALKELPDEVRNSLPALAVGGATYSENPASRMLIVNGRLFHEGDKLTSEVTLQQIKLRSAVLSYRGYRYTITY